MAFIIHIPDLLFVYLAYEQPPEFWKVVLCVCGENFGYGFGFTAYMIYMLYIAGQGEHKTSHFALCTGFMALGAMLPGMVSGALADALGWKHFFVLVCFATIPGFAILPFLPLDREFGRRKA
jgi:PAT family beta-lactamase induction signal transducer AmpG